MWNINICYLILSTIFFSKNTEDDREVRVKTRILPGRNRAVYLMGMPDVVRKPERNQHFLNET